MPQARAWQNWPKHDSYQRTTRGVMRRMVPGTSRHDAARLAWARTASRDLLFRRQHRHHPMGYRSACRYLKILEQRCPEALVALVGSVLLLKAARFPPLWPYADAYLDARAHHARNGGKKLCHNGLRK